jgi:hypothetical protein
MKDKDFFKKKIIHIYIVVFIVAILLVTAGLIMLKYHIEGEKNLPFNLTKISTISTAESNLYKTENETWESNIIQKNDIFFTIQRNDNYKKEDAIDKIIFDNFVIQKENNTGVTSVYMPSEADNKYTYSDEYIVSDTLEYAGGKTTNTDILQINNQGGVIGFSIATKNLGTYSLNENEKLVSDGTLLNKVNLKEEDIKFNISFDITIETKAGKKYKSNILLSLPTDNILEKGVSTNEDTDLKTVIFKRI